MLATASSLAGIVELNTDCDGINASFSPQNPVIIEIDNVRRFGCVMVSIEEKICEHRAPLQR